jgi:hypothetical protein
LQKPAVKGHRKAKSRAYSPTKKLIDRKNAYVKENSNVALKNKSAISSIYKQSDKVIQSYITYHSRSDRKTRNQTQQNVSPKIAEKLT